MARRDLQSTTLTPGNNETRTMTVRAIDSGSTTRWTITVVPLGQAVTVFLRSEVSNPDGSGSTTGDLDTLNAALPNAGVADADEVYTATFETVLAGSLLIDVIAGGTAPSAAHVHWASLRG